MIDKVASSIEVKTTAISTWYASFESDTLKSAFIDLYKDVSNWRINKTQYLHWFDIWANSKVKKKSKTGFENISPLIVTFRGGNLGESRH